MKRFVEGTDRGQSTFFPECLEDWICEDNPVRVIDLRDDDVALHIGANIGITSAILSSASC